MLKNHWYAVEFSEAVDLAPHKLRVFAQNLVLYRDRLGALVCHSDACVHCGTPLSSGKVMGDCIQCPSDGWEYDLEGDCTTIPSFPDDESIPLHARVDTYPCVEQYGYIFVFLGDLPGDRRPPGPRLPVLDVMPNAQAHGHRIVTGEFAWNANFERVIEHNLDTTTGPLVALGHQEIEEAHVGLWLTGVIGAPAVVPSDPSEFRKLFGAKPGESPVPVRVAVFFPNLTMLEVVLPTGAMRLYTAVVPVDETHTISKWTMCRTFSKVPLADGGARRRVQRMLAMAQSTVEAPRAAAHDLDDVHHPAAPGADTQPQSVRSAYHEWRQTVLSWGWGIEQAPDGGFDDWTETRVIPSPARRFHPELAEVWVLRELDPIEAHRDA